ncbi:MAG: glycerol-3-phosphate 1-O-acyltransferase PlsY [Phycisphaerae bacterium]|nr:glycerol-3-phosphate 1-O-acyltransferase PlsY [Phycisphaerae bacterium]
MNFVNFVILIVASYFLGSIPFALILAKLHKKDLFTIGSGNLGATNLSRALGKKWGYFCFLLDVCKGFIPMFIGSRMISSPPTTAELFLWLFAGIAAVMGHVFSIYIGFKGGKGVATSFGVALGAWPYFTLVSACVLVVWIICVLIWRYISLASIIAAFSFPLFLSAAIAILPDWNFPTLWPLLLAALLIAFMVTIRHKENIKRIARGTESKIFTKH